MEKNLEQEVRERAAGRCEYCRIPEQPAGLRHVIDHIIARQHGGPTVSENLALCCGRCNLSKWPNIAGIDPAGGQVTPLFNPRTDDWREHFRWDGPVLVGLTPPGRVTVEVLAINQPLRVAARRSLRSRGVDPLLPPGDRFRFLPVVGSAGSMESVHSRQRCGRLPGDFSALRCVPWRRRWSCSFSRSGRCGRGPAGWRRRF